LKMAGVVLRMISAQNATRLSRGKTAA